LCIESYPVFVPGKSKPQRIVEALNRAVTSIVWDKKRTARQPKLQKHSSLEETKSVSETTRADMS
jgi:hypothetical protein